MDTERTLVFNTDGTLDPAQLEGLPQEFIERVTAPAFIAHAKERIGLMLRGKRVRALANLEHQARRPNGISGRQRKKLRRIARRAIIKSVKENQL